MTNVVARLDRIANAPASNRIAELNDAFRRGQRPGRTFITPRMVDHCKDNLEGLMTLIRSFDACTPSCNPWCEHDLIALNHSGAKIFWKVIYFADAPLQYSSPDPAGERLKARIATEFLFQESQRSRRGKQHF